MLAVRRVYLYAVSAISLVAVTWAVIALARLILDEGIGQGQLIGLAAGLAVIIVGGPIFLFHWLMAERLVADSPEERTSPVRYLFFYGVLTAAALPVLSNIYRLVDDLLLALLGGQSPNYYPYDLSVPDHLAAILVWGVVWLFVARFVWGQVAQTGAPNYDINLTLRRLYLLGFSLGGLVMVAWGSFGLLQTIMEMLAGEVWRTPVANHSAQLLVGAAIWVLHWSVLQRNFAAGHPAEERSVLRKVYLYLTVFVFSIITIVGGTLLLKRLLELLLGAPPTGEPLLLQLSQVAPMLLVGGVLWAYHWTVVRQDAAQSPEGPRQAEVRRVYAYLVATVGLFATLLGVGGLLTLLVDMLTAGSDIGLTYYRESVAGFVSLTLMGLPVWLLPWRPSQARAVLPPAEAGRRDVGAEERRSIVRKIYLYLFVFLASLGIFGSVGWFVFHILTWVLGAELPNDFITQVLDAFVIALLAAGVWLYHWWAIRGDTRRSEQVETDHLADVLVVVIDGDEGQLGQAVVGKLREELPQLQLRPLGLTGPATAAMGGEPFSAALLKTASFIIGSWQSLTSGEAAAAVTASAATKLAVPLPAEKWLWAGVRGNSLEGYAAQTARGVKQALEGDQVDFQSGPDVATVAGIVVGGALFLCIAGSLLAGVVSLL